MRTDDLLDSYLKRVPGSRDAINLDPQFSMQTKWLRRALRLLDIAMEDEGVPEHVRGRVLRVVCYGTAEDVADAQLRISTTSGVTPDSLDAPQRSTPPGPEPSRATHGGT